MEKKWDNYFISIAKETSKLSKDPNTKVGCVLVKNKKILSIGYNGAPKTFNDKLVPKTNSEVLLESKNSYMVHAEANAILNYEGDLRNLSGSTAYLTISPCFECSKLLAQVGIKEVVYLDKYHREDITIVSDKILKCCGISQRKLYCSN